MNVLVTLNSNYLNQLVVMLTSLTQSNPEIHFIVYIAHTSMTEGDFKFINRQVDSENCTIVEMSIDDNLFHGAPITKRYPKEMYFRIFAAQFLPKSLDRILYLDPDIVVINPLSALYSIDFQENLFAAATDVYQPLEIINKVRLKMPKYSNYVNSGVMMLNLPMLRKYQKIQEVFDYIEEYRNRLIFPDQDVINGLYAGRIIIVDPKIYNLSERYWLIHNLKPKNKECKIDLDWIRRNTVIIHYCGKNKPWKGNYKGKLGTFYRSFEKHTLG
ncbi:glycosyltransferase family 8 protein [Desulfosporosinus sp. FKA]|uniref:glycosyltransferase family 8 protein n=1 Tax=Desulfosporosinus sp. FKA TaxID=1969834 RepID=UPI000B49E8BC|nr:glycosyltransferase family 8 protein [Desulfosporosinus sp. FKA]